MNKPLLTILLALVFGLITACDRPLNAMTSWGERAPVAITIDQIVEAGQPGQFTLSGSATLPEPLPLTVSAVQFLPPLNGESPEVAAPFAILDRTTVVVSNGRWQAQLDLSQLGNSELPPAGSPATPVSSTIDFRATVEPRDFARSGLNRRQETLASASDSLLNFTPDGEPYLKANKGQTVTVSRARTPAPTSTAIAQPWEQRSRLDPLDSSRRDPQPLPFEETDSLPLPKDSVMR